jgi:hypothetical protein
MLDNITRMQQARTPVKSGCIAGTDILRAVAGNILKTTPAEQAAIVAYILARYLGVTRATACTIAGAGRTYTDIFCGLSLNDRFRVARSRAERRVFVRRVLDQLRHRA